jgi:hypothetical protein
MTGRGGGWSLYAGSHQHTPLLLHPLRRRERVKELANARVLPDTAATITTLLLAFLKKSSSPYCEIVNRISKKVWVKKGSAGKLKPKTVNPSFTEATVSKRVRSSYLLHYTKFVYNKKLLSTPAAEQCVWGTLH